LHSRAIVHQSKVDQVVADHTGQFPAVAAYQDPRLRMQHAVEFADGTGTVGHVVPHEEEQTGAAYRLLLA